MEAFFNGIIIINVIMILAIFITGLFLIGYLFGSIPFGLIVSRLAGAGDIRKIGSGNTGATNVLRTGKKWAAALTLLLDFGKVFMAVFAAGFVLGLIEPDAGNMIQIVAIIAGLAAVVGHCFPVWLGFKGGKGFASTLGFLFILNPLLCAVCLAVWLLVAITTKISSLSALSVLVVMPFAAYFMGFDWFVIGAVAFLSILGLIMHRENIRRLINGTESKIKF